MNTQHIPLARKEDNESAEGFLKISWVKRLRSQPVIVAVFISRAELESDPWSVLVKRFESIKNTSEAHHCKVIAVVVNDRMEELPTDVLSTFKSRFSLDEKSLFTLLAIKVDPNDPSLIQLANNELKSIGHVFLENSWALHQTHVQRILLKSSQKVSPSTRLSSWENTKLGFLAEVRQEWTTAVGQYTTAYTHLLEALRTRRFQSAFYIECLSVAEVLIMRICTLLMHQQRSEDAWKHFQIHLTKLRRTPPDGLTVGLKAFFLGWLSHQYLIMLDIVELRNGDHNTLLSASIVSNRHLVNLYYYAAEAAVQQRRHVSFALTKLSSGQGPVPSPTHWGQFECPVEELDDCLLALEAQKDLLKTSVSLLELTLEYVKRCRCGRREAQVSMMLAEERLASGEVDSAKELLLKAADVYRRDGWTLLLSRALKLLIEISQEASWEKIVYSFELATMEDISENEERRKFADSAIESLLSNQTSSCGSEITEESSTETPVFKGELKNLSWGSILEVVCGFQSPKATETGNLRFGVAIKNKLPVDLPLSGLSLHLVEQGIQDRILPWTPAPSTPLVSNEWNLHTLEFTPLVHGAISVKSVEILFGSQSTLLWNLPVTNELILGDREDPWRGGTQITPGLHSAHVTHVGAAPALNVICPSEAYLGEEIPITVQITSVQDNCKVEKLFMELSTGVSEVQVKWKETNSPVVEIQDLKIMKNEIWTQQHFIKINFPTKMVIQVKMKLNSEFEVVEKLEFEIKEPFVIQCQVFGPPLTYLYIPKTGVDALTGSENPLSVKAAAELPDSSINLPEDQDSFLKVSIKSKADCEMIIRGIEYSCSQASDIQITEVTGPKTEIQMHKNDVSTVLLKIKTGAAFDTLVALSAGLTWSRVQKGKLKSVVGSEEDMITDDQRPLVDCRSSYSMLNFHVKKPMLSASLQPQCTANTGIPFPYKLHLTNSTNLPQELNIVIAEAPGCLFCGDRKTRVLIHSKETTQLQWECVAHISGNVKLPKALISSTRLDCSVEIEGIEIYVKPPVLM
eukprot:g3312.t1